jgi:anaerobic magnesium-protoporphyrin IX monomethyl ester cyclase
MKPARVVLVKPPERSRLNFGAFSLGVLAAAVRQQADVAILDATSLAVDEAARAVLGQHPDFVGVTAMGMESVAPVAAFIRSLRRESPNIAAHLSKGATLTVIAGGHGATMLPQALLQAGADAVVVGEGELTLQQILEDGIVQGMAGVVCLEGEGILAGPGRRPVRPLDRLPLPARDLMPGPPDGVHLIETSRGCPHACTFCEATLFHGRVWRPHSAARVALEAAHLVEDYGAWIIHFADDNFAADPDRVLEICDRLRGGPLPALILASGRADDILADHRVIPAMAGARILRVSVGVETTEPALAGATGKSIPIDGYREAFARMREQGMFSLASFIVGLPGETGEMRRRAVQLAIESGADAARFLPFLPLPGTPLAAERTGSAPDPADVQEAERFTSMFFESAVVRERLTQAARAGGVRGLLARGALREAGQLEG